MVYICDFNFTAPLSPPSYLITSIRGVFSAPHFKAVSRKNFGGLVNFLSIHLRHYSYALNQFVLLYRIIILLTYYAGVYS